MQVTIRKREHTMTSFGRALLFLACFGCAGAHAGIIFTLGNNPQPNEENVLLNSGATGNLVTGVTNTTGKVVDFSSTQVLTEPANGQARIEATNGTSQVALTDVTVSLANDTLFHDIIFNPFIGGTIGTTGGTLTATVTAAQNGVPEAPSTFSYTLSNGNNFLTIVASGGEAIQSVNIGYPVGFTDLRQIRISGPFSQLENGVPEPPTSLLASLALLLLAVWRPRFTHRR